MNNKHTTGYIIFHQITTFKVRVAFDASSNVGKVVSLNAKIALFF